jgi:thiamine biosynthesis lipoprotein
MRPRPPIALLAPFVIVLAVCACDLRREHTLTGRTMGTTYSVTLVTGAFGSVSGLKGTIDRRLEEINRAISPYLKESEISRFNRYREVGVEFPISDDFMRVMRTAARLYALSDGAWDGTVGPLVDLWGFGRGGNPGRVPGPEAVAALLADVGFDQIEIRDGALVKRRAAVSLDLSSVGQGYGVDQIVAVLRAAGFTDFLVEVGGEIYGAGTRPDGRAWRVGISRPVAGARPDDIHHVVAVRDQAFSTSGDYRQFFVQHGVRYSHHIDPATGYPVRTGPVSVSILAPESCTFVDGLGTAVLVLGLEKGLALIERLDGVAGLLVVERADGSLQDYLSTRMRLEPAR